MQAACAHTGVCNPIGHARCKPRLGARFAIFTSVNLAYVNYFDIVREREQETREIPSFTLHDLSDQGRV